HKLPLIFTDGACLNNGYDGARAGYGVVISNDAQGRKNFAFSGDQERTNQKAELAGVKKGLELAFQAAGQQGRAHSCPTPSYKNFVIATDSEYAVKGITEWLPIASNGRRPINEAEFREIDYIMERHEAMGHNVALWHIPRSFNADADQLAGQGA
ncbi:ribonuclease H-like domain-containing protein, partial [Phyllosticta citribraziliensis]